MTTTISNAATRRRLQRASLLLLMLAALALPVQAPASAQVPLKGSDAGTWGQGSHDCGSLFPVRVDGVGHASSIGRYAYASRECVDFSQTPFPYQGRFTITARNGDTIVGTYAGTASIDDDGVTILYDQTATITGGTGRFADAAGRPANEILKAASGFFATELDADRPDRGDRLRDARDGLRRGLSENPGGGAMAVAIRTTDFPEGVGTAMYDGVQAAMDIANDPPEGLIFHWAGEVDGKWTVTDVWKAREAYDRFREERLFPAIQKVAGMDPATGPQPTVTEFAVHNYVKP